MQDQAPEPGTDHKPRGSVGGILPGMQETRPKQHRPDRARFIEAAALALLAMGLGLLHLAHPPRYDELFHVLAAQSWAADGTLRIGDGEYRRAPLFTILLGSLFSWFGDGLVVARSAPLVANSILVAAIFLWTRSVADRGTAWIAALMFALSINSIYLSLFIRFYSLHALLFFLATISTHALLTRQTLTWPSRAALAITALACFALAMQLQVTTLVGMAAIGTWWFLTVAAPRIVADVRGGRALRWAALGAASACAAGLAAFFGQDILRELWQTYTFQALWARGTSASIYHWILLGSFPTFYSLLPAVICAGLYRNAPIATFATIIFGVGLAVHSFGGMRGEHYIYYLMPFFVVLCALALASLLQSLPVLVATAWTHLDVRPWPQRYKALPALVLGAATIAFIWASNPALYRTARFVQEGPGFLHPQHQVDWGAARGPLREAARNADVVVSTNGLSALRDLGRLDVEFSATILFETETGEEFSRYGVTGKPVIGSARSLEVLMDCFTSGLVISEREQFGSEIYGITPAAVTLLEKRATRLPIPEGSGLLAFRWSLPSTNQTGHEGIQGPACKRLHSRLQTSNRR